ncbi:MAG TPA: M28 family metallopeptidase [Candidatus Eisenbacteria bacterium]|nr:M28 family metallopeptidase [Candidatus Eisenbacteria bacterium]
MPMKSRAVLAILAAAGALLAALVALSSCGSDIPAESQWMSHVRALADDHLRGRETATEGFRQAASYVARELKRYGVEPRGDSGTYYQRVPFLARRVDESRSRVTILHGKQRTEALLGEDVILSMRLNPADSVDARLVFVGYGLHIPDAGWDDLEGLDLKGAVAVYMRGGPERVPGPLLAHASSRAERWRAFRRAGAVGMIEIRGTKKADFWKASSAARLGPALTLDGREFDEVAGMKVQLFWRGDRTAPLFQGTKHRFEEIERRAKDGERPPRFELSSRLRARIASSVRPEECRNVVGLIRGSDKKLREQYVVLSAHLDHLGVGPPVEGDSIYNGAMDNASGCATLLEVARMIKRSGHAPKRSLLFLFTTAEESGLWGSAYFTARPTVPARRIVADLNIDMFLPIQPIRGITAYGIDESDLGDVARRVAKSDSLKIVPDPKPARLYFVRSDQYSFIRHGIPAIFIDAGPTDTAAVKAEDAWNDAHYHKPSDDAAQTIDLGAVARFDRYILALTRAVADGAKKPQWKRDSHFRNLGRGSR